MSSPTILGNQSSGDTSLYTICNLVRSLVNDTQPGAEGFSGEGQIFTDNDSISPFVQPLLNSSIRELYRELRNVGQPTLIKDNVIVTGLTPVNSPTYGLGSTDPAVQVYLSFGGYFDGVAINSDLVLPGDVITMEAVWERQTNSNNPFIPMSQPEMGLPSRYQTPALGQWEWRNDSIWMVGSTQQRDLRLRYWCSLPQFFSETLDFKSTYVPIIDCVDAVAYKTAVKYATMLGSPGLADLKLESIEQMRQLKLQSVRRQQAIDYSRPPYASNGGSGMGNVFGWN